MGATDLAARTSGNDARQEARNVDLPQDWDEMQQILKTRTDLESYGSVLKDEPDQSIPDR